MTRWFFLTPQEWKALMEFKKKLCSNASFLTSLPEYEKKTRPGERHNSLIGFKMYIIQKNSRHRKRKDDLKTWRQWPTRHFT
jgi:hypothetical protein